MSSLRSLFFKIFKLGATAYGGPAMISQIKETTVNRYQWVKEGEFMRGVALCQLIPGILGSFIGMLALVLYNFGKVSLVDIPRILMATVAFVAIYKKINLPYILLTGALFSIVYWGLLK
jgi:chromate transporter